MALQLTSAITDGFRRSVTRTGAMLFVFLFATQFLLITSLNTVMASAVPADVTGQIGLTLPVSQTVAGGILAGTYLFSSVYFVVAARALTRPLTDLSTFPSTLYTRRIGRATLSMIIGSLLIFVAVMIGFAFLIIPGLILAACFFCYIFTIGVEDCGAIGGLKRSWGLSRGSRIKLVALVVLIGLLGGVVGVVPAVASAAGAQAAGDALAVLINSLLFVPVYGIMAAAYLQLSSETGVNPSEGLPTSSPSDPSAQ